MKRNFLNQIVLCVSLIFTSLVVFISCKKDKLTEPPQNTNQEVATYDFKTNQVVQRIKRFDNQLKKVKQGVCRSNHLVDVDSTIWNMESLFNVTYSSPDENYVDKKIQELSFTINLIDNKLSIIDVGNLYDEIVMSVREAYRNDGITTDKSLMSLFLKKEEMRSGELKVRAVVVSGRTNEQQHDYEPILYGPFDADECWYYGELGGSCDDPYILTDAAELLEDTINYIHGYKPEKNSTCRNIYVNLMSVNLSGNEYWDKNNNEYYIFYKEDCEPEELYLDVNELNKYYYNELKVIKDFVPKDPKYMSMFGDDYVFMEINIDGICAYQEKTINQHQNYIFYGSPYTVNKNEFGSTMNLLNN